MKTVIVPCEAHPGRLRPMLLARDPYDVSVAVLPSALTVRRVRLATVALCAACPVAVPEVFARALSRLTALADSGHRTDILRRTALGQSVLAREDRTQDELLEWTRSRPDSSCPYLVRLFNRLWTIHLPYSDPGVDLRTVTAYQDPDTPEADILRTVFHGGPSPNEPLPTTLFLPPEAQGLALSVYDNQDRVALAILADLLDENGNPENATRALRNPHAALRGNWVVDAILGRKP